MVCLPMVHLDTDIPFWVSRVSFLQHFDQDDFRCRKVQSVIDAYLEDWFHIDPAGRRHFKIPPVSVHSARTQFISGRHRTAVLLRHLEHVPLSFDFRDISQVDKDWLHRVVECPVDLTADIVLPDLPIMDKLP